MSLDTQYLSLNRDLRSKAREGLKGRWGLPLGLCFVIGLISGMASSMGFVSLIIGGALELGLSIFFLKWIRNEEPDFDDGFKGFNYFGASIGLYLLQLLFIMLWTLLFIIPGIIKAFSYSQAFYILADNPDLGPIEAITLSRRMMDGAKGKLFALYLHFFILGILCLFTLGIGFLWLIPFINTARAEFYEDLKKNYREF